MNTEQALQILKAAIDESIKKGVFPNMETVQQTIVAFSVVTTEINKKDKANG